MRGDQLMAQALVGLILGAPVEKSEALIQAVENTRGAGATNLGHMALALDLLLITKSPRSLRRLKEMYADTFAGYFRTKFEGLSVSYSKYQSIAAIAVRLLGPDMEIKRMARKFIRWDVALQALCTTRTGKIVMPCGRMYPNTGGHGDVSDYRMRAILEMNQLKWTVNWWAGYGHAALPWRELSNLPAAFFSREERDAFKKWVMERKMSPLFAAILQNIPDVGLNVLPTEEGHIAWMDSVESYGGGDNMAQPAIEAKNGTISSVVFVDPPAYTILSYSSLYTNGQQLSIYVPSHSDQDIVSV